MSGPARRRLWTANTWLRACWPQIEAGLGARIAAGHARALDLACGTGRDAVWLAERGLHVEAVDRLPDALERAGDLAARCGVTLSLQRRDLERDSALPQGRYDLVTCFCFLHRPLLDAVPAALRPGGFACVRTFDRTERERSGRPRRARLVLEPGELRRR
ncbi:MAG: class I SAM-dependent methyltransferase, partial [Planctomycetota bacterium]